MATQADRSSVEITNSSTSARRTTSTPSRVVKL
jgi:hypothetical protein